MLLYIYTRSHQSEWMMMMSERVRAVRVRVRAARTSPVQSLAAKPASDPGGDRGVRALADRSLAITATHKFFSVDFQIFSKMTVSDVFQIQIFTHTHLGRDRADQSYHLSLNTCRDILASRIFQSC